MDNNNTLIIIIAIGLLLVITLVVWLLKSSAKRKQAALLGKQKVQEERAKFELQRQESLIAKYGEELGLKIIAKSYFAGMTKEQVLEAKSQRPDKIEIEEQKNKETWYYGAKSQGDIFVFQDDVLVKFKTA